jgi:FkbM family methyltransferase
MNPNLIFDVGLHVGQDTDFYLKKGFKVVAVEANPQLVEECKGRFRADIARGDLTIVNIGIAEREGTLPFYVNEKLSEWSSFDERIGAGRGAYHVIQVPTRPLSSIIGEYGVPYYVKLDIEGMDHPAIVSMRDTAEKPKYVSAENGHDFMIDELYAQGYRRFKFVNQSKIHEITLHEPAKEGVFVRHQFPFGASGPFGDEISGEWLNREQVTAMSQAYWSNPNRDANLHGWFDIHASL